MRNRLPTKYGVAQVVPHAITIACSIATVFIAVYKSVRHDYAKEMTGDFVAAIWTMTMDSYEITALSDKKRRVKRLTTGWLALVEFLIAVLCITAPSWSILSYKRSGVYFECGGRPQKVCDDEQAWNGRATVPAFAAYWDSTLYLWS